MITGVSYNPYYFRRDIGDRPEDIVREQEYRQSRNTEYRGREVGENPYEVPSRAQQAEYARQAEATRPTTYSDSYQSVPREVGETPADVARTTQPQRPKRYDEMTEQERVLDLYA